ncbi:hypothetical protein [Candidatus Sororendozoicomonas aggregata]|uniref:ubiquinone biosynthesis accessory factor UbiJ n=1 Tax=Candidatus Sororendozoicomonas aggregata TaxID=3073239 RepID=UPI002ED2D6E3
MNSPFSLSRLLSEPTIKMAVLTGLEKQLNKVLLLDPLTLKKLGELSGTVVDVQCSDPEFQCYVFLDKVGLRLASYHEGSVDTGLRGSLVTLADTVAHRDNPLDKVVGLETWGSADTLSRLSDIHQSVKFDWEGALCKVFGDIGGHMLSQGLSFASEQTAKVRKTAVDNLEGYLQEEIQLLPSRNEVEAFASDVAELQSAVDALAQSISPLKRSS